MDTEDALPLPLMDSESPEIVSVSSSLLNSTTLSPAPCTPPDTLTSLLLQIQQYHSSELQKLQGRINRWKTKCEKLAEISNNNAYAAKKYFKHNKLLVIEVVELKCQLKALQNPSLAEKSLSETSTIQAGLPDKASPKEEPTGTNTHDNQNQALSKKSSKVFSKLTSRKSRKKVRYSEISPKEKALQKCAAEETIAQGFPEQISTFTASKSSEKGLASKPCDLLNWKKVRVAGTLQSGRILAPDTCPSPTMQAPSPLGGRNSGSGANPSGHDKTKLSLGGPEQRIIKGRHVEAVPETLGVSNDDVTSLDLSIDNIIDAPTYASTPVGGQSQFSYTLESPQKRQTHKTMQVPDSCLKDAFPETPSRQQVLSTSMPKTESQYPVDLYNTQVKSPTFCGESSTASPKVTDGLSQHHRKTAAGKNVHVPTTSRVERTDVYDESCDSETSILLLGQQKTVLDKSLASQSFYNQRKGPLKAIVSMSKPDQVESAERTLSYHNVARTSSGEPMASLNNKLTKSNEEVTNGTLQSPAYVKWMSNSKKRKLNSEHLLSYDETVLPSSATTGKENSPERLNDSIILSSLNQISKRESTSKKGKLPCENSGAAKVQLTKPLKQSKLTANLFQPGMKKSTNLIQEYNGGDLISGHVDSQLDTYINKAIELSLVDQKEVGNNRKDMLLGSEVKMTKLDAANPGSEVASVGFKIPSVPHQKKQPHCDPQISPTDKMAVLEDLPDSLEFTSTPHDLNGSLDPLMDLTGIESDGSSPCQLGQSGQKKQLGSGRLDTTNQESSIRRVKGGDDSCIDLFEEEDEEVEDEDDEGEDNPDSEQEMDKSEGEPRTGYIRNFDNVPKKNEQPNFKYTEVVRKRDDRQKLKGFGCKECDAFYGGLLLTDAEREDRMKACSRHRAQFSPPNTPDHYWSVGFPDTQTCLQRGYIKEASSPDRRTRRGKNKYRKLFSGKEVEDAKEDDEDSS